MLVYTICVWCTFVYMVYISVWYIFVYTICVWCTFVYMVVN